ncbi:MAG: LptF/LptG family permease [Bacteroidota bacterium]|nr:LptF/LptG family permease [Candidatus Kapabacteria bacterium]MDW8218980.1 LptF/LptG family permease [Bacteroidota bacterium]
MYILRAHLAPFLFGVFTVVFIFLLNFLIIFLPQMVGKGLGTSIILELIILNMAWMITLAVPLGVLVATLMAFGTLVSTHEVTIIKASGVSLVRMMRPVLLASGILSLWLFWFNDSVLPDANYRAQMLMIDIQRKKPTFILNKGQFSSQIEGYTILARDIDTARGVMLGVTLYDNTSFDVVSVVSADTGVINFSTDYKKAVLILYRGELHQTNQHGIGDYKRVQFQQHQVIMDASGFAFTYSDASLHARGDRTMRIADMQQVVNDNLNKITSSRQAIHRYVTQQLDFVVGPDTTIQEIQASRRETSRQDSAVQPSTRKDAAWRSESRITGVMSMLESEIFNVRDKTMTANKYLVEIHKKYAIPAICFIFAFVGCPLGVITKRGNFGISGAITLVFYVIYWIFLLTGERLADRGLMAPWLAMWLGDIVLGVVGGILVWQVSQGVSVGEKVRNRIAVQTLRNRATVK